MRRPLFRFVLKAMAFWKMTAASRSDFNWPDASASPRVPAAILSLIMP